MIDFKIASCQMDVVDNKNENIKHAVSLIEYACQDEDVQLVTLPEMFNTPYSNSKFVENSEKEADSVSLRSIRKIAKRNSVYIQSGSIAEIEDNKIYNSAYLVNPSGDIIAKHRKVHLFDIDTEGIRFMESDTLTAGDNITTVDTDLGRIGIAICYDVRFSQFWTLMCEDCDVVLLPGAFNMTTGPAHWETLIRARAIDNQVYVVATSPSRRDNPYYVAWAHSMIVDPWGKIVSRAGFDEEILYADVTQERIDTVRREIPVLKNRRDDIYKTIRK